MNKVERQQRNDNRQKVLEVLRTYPEGMLSVEVSNLTGISVNTVKRVLIFLRDRGEVFSSKVLNKKRTQRWFYVVTIGEPPPALKSIAVPYPDLDKTHAEWITNQKPVYNPWGRA